MGKFDGRGPHSAKQLSPNELYHAKLELYRNKQSYFQSRIESEPAAAERWSAEATAWGRLADLRRLVRAKQTETAAALDQIRGK